MPIASGQLAIKDSLFDWNKVGDPLRTKPSIDLFPQNPTPTQQPERNDSVNMANRAQEIANGVFIYDPQLGRFISEDPIGLAGGISLYLYAEADPVGFTDPFGLCPQGSNKPLGPCVWEEERDMRSVAALFGGQFNFEGPAGNWNWDFKIPQEVTEFRIIQIFRRNGFIEITNPFHIGTDFEKRINGRWYHFTVNDPWFGDLYITEHFEISQPSSSDHRGNFWQAWDRPPEAECLARQLGNVGGGELKHLPKRRPQRRNRRKK